MANTTLKTNQSIASKFYNLACWGQERFQVAGLITGFLLAAFWIYSTGVTTSYTNFFASGAIVTCWLLILRILDEHKDYKRDLVNFPNRVLQSGRVSLSDLRLLGLGLVGVICAIHFGIAETTHSHLGLALTVTWTGLMTVEFFSAKFLHKHQVAYSVLHLAIMICLGLWVMMLNGAAPEVAAPFAITVFINALVYEFSRKLPVAEESEEVHRTERFSPQVGMVGVATGLALSGATAVYLWSEFFSSINVFYIVGPILIFQLGTLGTIVGYSKDQTEKKRKAIEGMGALYVLAFYITFIVCSQL